MNFTKAATLSALAATATFASVSVSIDATKDVKPISPYIYGRNIDGIDGKTAELSEDDIATIETMNEAGVRFMRANNGNNSTRYNWRKKLTVHPDWYNNVEPIDWDITAQKIQENMPYTNAMYAFQLTGYAASTREYNFPDWDFYINHDKNWAKATLDLAGGGEVSEDGQTLIKAGDYRLYTESWPADSTVGIIDHWKNELKYDMGRFQYWSMDNEMEIWAGTHSDLQLDVTGDFLVERYIDVAKKARDAWPGIKLTGPVVANEWYWCSIAYKGGTSGRIKKSDSGEDRDYCWLEYFIKKVAAAQKASGKRLIDVFDIHWYPDEKKYDDQVQWHRVFFDTNYVYPGANSIKQVNGGWDETITKEFIFKRINDWLDKYFGKDHGITLALTETDLGTAGDPMTTALIYASWLGTFMNNGVEIFTPWTWREGMYEVLHLFSRYNHENRVAAVSSNDSLVSAYASVNKDKNGLTVIFVNRDKSTAQSVDVDVSNYEIADGEARTLTLAGLTGETFKSHKENALKTGSAKVASNKLALELPAKSIVAVTFGKEAVLTAVPKVASAPNAKLFYRDNAWFIDNTSGDVQGIAVRNALGKAVASWGFMPKGEVKLAANALTSGVYIVQVRTAKGMSSHRIEIR